MYFNPPEPGRSILKVPRTKVKVDPFLGIILQIEASHHQVYKTGRSVQPSFTHSVTSKAATVLAVKS